MENANKCGLCSWESTDVNGLSEHLRVVHAFDIDVSDCNSADNNPTDENCPPEMLDDNASDNSAKRLWTPKDTLLLVSLVEQMDSKLKIMKKASFTRIGEEIAKVSGIQCTYVQADSKWKSLKRTYKKIKKSQKKSGGRVQWQFFEVMDNMLGPSTRSGTTMRSNASRDSALTTSRKRKCTENELLVVLRQNHAESMALGERFLNKMDEFMELLKH